MDRFRRVGLLAATAVALAVSVLALPGAALASCAPPPPLHQALATADIVFVGTVTQTVNNGTWANVMVEEVWRGPDQPAEVVVRGGAGGQLMTSVDRTFQGGARYLFVPYGDEQGGLEDNSCSSTTPWSEELDVLRPAEIRRPVGVNPTPTGFDPGAFIAPIGIAVIVAGALLGIGLLARGRNPA